MASPSTHPSHKTFKSFRIDMAEPIANEEELRAVFNSPALGISFLTSEGRFFRANKAFCSITGYSAVEVLSLDYFAILSPDDRKRTRNELALLLSGETEALVLEQRYARKNGEMVWVQDNLTLTRDSENIPSIIAISQDITERKRSEERIRMNQTELGEKLAETELLRDLSAQLVEQGNEQALHEKIVEVIATIMRSDFATMQVFYPKRGPKGELHMLASKGLSPEAQEIWEWVTFDTDSTCGQALRTGKRAIASDVTTCEFLEGTPGGKNLLDSGIRAAQSTPLFSRNGKFMGMVSSHWRVPHTPTDRDLRFLDIIARQAADLIERQRSDDELRRLNHDLEQFAYTAGHDLQEPLRTIKAFSDLLNARCADELKGDAAVYLGFMTGAATRMEILIRDLLSYTQVDKEPSPLQKIAAEIPLGSALANLAGAIEESNAVVSFDPLPEVNIHATHLRQLFQNLIGNAVKYRHPERECKVHVSAERQGVFWVFSVRDNGVGIDPKYKDQIFGLFTRLGSKDAHSGTGLGLAICKRIVERYHGRIWVQSKHGSGSDFRFTFPA